MMENGIQKMIVTSCVLNQNEKFSQSASVMSMTVPRMPPVDQISINVSVTISYWRWFRKGWMPLVNFWFSVTQWPITIGHRKFRTSFWNTRWCSRWRKKYHQRSTWWWRSNFWNFRIFTKFHIDTTRKFFYWTSLFGRRSYFISFWKVFILT